MSSKDLAKRILEASDAYYNGTPTMSDAEYDHLVKKLHSTDPQNPVLRMVGCPIREDSKLQKVQHEIEMGSLGKVNTLDEFNRWAAGKGKCVVQEKLDGISVSLKYENGAFVQAVTRGDGAQGEDITHNVRLMQGFPQGIPPAHTVYVRGEIILKKSVFQALFSKEYANPRNTVAGLSRKKDTNLLVGEFMVVCYDTTNDSFGTETSKLIWLANNGFKVAHNSMISPKECYDAYKSGVRATLDYDIDGLVVKVNNIRDQIDMGSTDGRPKGQIAWKFDAEAEETLLKSVTWQVGRGGRITPVAELSPVGIGGVTITRASLHNCSNIERLGLVWEDTPVLVSRRNDVIPYVESVVEHGDGKRIEYPEFCPTCDGTVEYQGEYLVCTNLSCPSRKVGDIEKWIDIMEMRELGPSFVDDLITIYGAKDVSGLYTVTKKDLLQFGGYAEKKAEKVFGILQSKKTVPLSSLLAGMNIQGVGSSVSATLVKNGINTLDKLRTVSVADLRKIKGVGDVIADAIVDGLKNKKDVIQHLIDAGITIQEKTASAGILCGKSFCFTGSLPSGMARGVAQKLVSLCGGEVKTSVSKDLDYLVQANKSSVSSKTQKAVKYGTQVIDEDDFLDMIKFTPSMLSKLV